ncbi:MAG: DUF5752 family protein [Deltaproteobacteria bacterium]|nr:DUF5752 family protein [Deltaproteobacteria bacterium]
METIAKYPFKFYTRLTLPQLTGIYALNLKELLDGIKKSDDSIIYYHTHHYLIQHHYVVPDAPNDFAHWIINTLGEKMLGEEISSIDMFAYNTMDDYRQELTRRLTAFISKDSKTRRVEMNERFNFMKAVTFVMSTGKEAYTLREFHDILKNITIFSVYYHFFESHFRLSSGFDDFSAWIRDELQLPDLAAKIAYIDPYSVTMDKLKEQIINYTEKYF